MDSGRAGGGARIASRLALASRIAALVPARACTHNEGVLNGIEAVAVATGNDWRAVSAGAHAWAASTGAYQPLATWTHADETLHGALELPLALGVVGGARRLHRAAALAARPLTRRVLETQATAVGLACNLAALRALVDEGIQRGHMRLAKRGQS